MIEIEEEKVEKKLFFSKRSSMHWNMGLRFEYKNNSVKYAQCTMHHLYLWFRWVNFKCCIRSFVRSFLDHSLWILTIYSVLILINEILFIFRCKLWFFFSHVRQGFEYRTGINLWYWPSSGESKFIWTSKYYIMSIS